MCNSDAHDSSHVQFSHFIIGGKQYCWDLYLAPSHDGPVPSAYKSIQYGCHIIVHNANILKLCELTDWINLAFAMANPCMAEHFLAPSTKPK